MFNNLRAETARKNYTYDVLAQQLGITTKSYSNKVNGKSQFTLTEAMKLAGFLGCDVGYLFEKGDK